MRWLELPLLPEVCKGLGSAKGGKGGKVVFVLAALI